MIKTLALVIVLIVLVGLGGITYFGWNKADMSGISGREGIVKGQESIGYVDIKQKLTNAVKSNSEVTITEAEMNQYIAKNLKMNQGGLFKDYSSVKGVYVDLTEDQIEIFIEREIAQYGDEGVIDDAVLPPFNHTVSMKVKAFNGENDKGEPVKTVEFPSATIGKVPAPNQLAKIVLPSFKQINDHFEEELALGYEKMNGIKITEGIITLDPRPVVK